MASEDSDDLDTLYAATPQDFTQLRTELSAAAKKRGDAEAAKQLKAARKPTTAAWVVNNLVHNEAQARDRLRDLSDQLRTAHAEMDGERIRALSAEQRQLVSRLTREALTAAEQVNPSAALRDDVSQTLQAAIADPEVAARLGRLVKAEQWSGFGFGESFGKTPPPKKPQAPEKAPKKKPAPKNAASTEADDTAAQRRRELDSARAAMAQARKAKADSDKTLVTRHEELATARTRHDEAQRTLRAAEKTLQDAERAYNDAEQDGLAAAARIAELRDLLEQLRG
jgi:chromosome segregation ATPase